MAGVLALVLAAGCHTPIATPPPRAIQLEAKPAAATLTVGHGMKLGYSIVSDRGSEVIWSADGGSLDAQGMYTAPAKPGAYTVRLQAKADPTVSRAIPITVVPAPDATIQAPSRVKVGVAASASVPTAPGCRYAWTLQGGRIEGPDNIDRVRFVANGSAPLSLQCTVTNAAGDRAATTQEILIQRDVLAITPAQAVLTVGSSRTFGLEGAAQATWKVLDAKGGSLDAAGRYTAPALPGTYRIEATQEGVTAQATVKVVATPAGKLLAPDALVAGAKGLKASISAAPGLSFRWNFTGGPVHGQGAEITFDVDQPKGAVLSCILTNEAGDTLTLSKRY
jgi:hypothetical protein